MIHISVQCCLWYYTFVMKIYNTSWWATPKYSSFSYMLGFSFSGFSSSAKNSLSFHEDCVGFIELEQCMFPFKPKSYYACFCFPLEVKVPAFTVKVVPMIRLLLLTLFSSSELWRDDHASILSLSAPFPDAGTACSALQLNDMVSFQKSSSFFKDHYTYSITMVCLQVRLKHAKKQKL